MTPGEQARAKIDEKLIRSGWIIQDKDRLNLSASLGVAVREFPTSAGPADYVLFVDGTPVGIVDAKIGNRIPSLCLRQHRADC